MIMASVNLSVIKITFVTDSLNSTVYLTGQAISKDLYFGVWNFHDFHKSAILIIPSNYLYKRRGPGGARLH
jgi:hypothetical protein